MSRLTHDDKDPLTNRDVVEPNAAAVEVFALPEELALVLVLLGDADPNNDVGDLLLPPLLLAGSGKPWPSGMVPNSITANSMS